MERCFPPSAGFPSEVEIASCPYPNDLLIVGRFLPVKKKAPCFAIGFARGRDLLFQFKREGVSYG